MTIDEKDLYWSEELNKHDHKKFEVEVINTIKIRLMDRMGPKFWDLKPTFQAYVKRDNGKALIDLTFDAINVGLEVDEGHHARQKEADKKRELNILEKMAMIGRDDFEICRVDVTHGVEKKMEDIEKFLQCVRKHVSQHKKFNWDDRPGFVRYNSGDKIKFKDNFEFITKSDLFNTLLQTPKWGKASKGKNSYVEELYKKYGYKVTVQEKGKDPVEMPVNLRDIWLSCHGGWMPDEDFEIVSWDKKDVEQTIEALKNGLI